jgi:alpha-D-ribose 1-methylphosphonate 5-phosphate C-P lyase
MEMKQIENKCEICGKKYTYLTVATFEDLFGCEFVTKSICDECYKKRIKEPICSPS